AVRSCRGPDRHPLRGGRVLGGTREAFLCRAARSGPRSSGRRPLSRALMAAKLPVSVLVVVHTPQLEILLLERAARPGFWQSVTGSLDHPGEPLEAAALREVEEETGIGPGEGRLVRCNAVNTFEIFP